MKRKIFLLSLLLLLLHCSLIYSDVTLTDQEAEEIDQALQNSETQLTISENKINQLSMELNGVKTLLMSSESIINQQKILYSQLEEYLTKQKEDHLTDIVLTGVGLLSIGFVLGVIIE